MAEKKDEKKKRPSKGMRKHARRQKQAERVQAGLTTSK